MGSKQIIESLLKEAGIEINGNNSHDIQVHNEDFYQRVVAQGSLGLGESYMDGWWDCENLDEFFYRLLRARIDEKVKINIRFLLPAISALIFNMQNKSRAFKIGEKHYDVGNDLYQYMLDKRLTYTCGYWQEAETLDEAQEAKLDLVCRKLNLKKGMKVLDIGCGWGSFMKYAAEKYGVRSVGVTVSKEQVELGRKLCQGLPVEIRLQDYRDVNEKFDHIVSLGMFEHVGYKNFHTFMETAHRLLDDNGLFLLHTIGGNKSVKTPNLWVDKYIFPNSMLPSLKQIGAAIEKFFVAEDCHNFGVNYDRTLMSWYENFDKNWDKIKSSYDERFYRMWKFYLLICAGAFRARKNQLWQIVLSKKGILGIFN